MKWAHERRLLPKEMDCFGRAFDSWVKDFDHARDGLNLPPRQHHVEHLYYWMSKVRKRIIKATGHGATVLGSEPGCQSVTNACGYCGLDYVDSSRTPSLKKCSRCMSIAYCSQECQRSHWKTHKPTCSIKA